MATGIALEDDAPPPQRTAPGDGWEDVNVTSHSPPRSASPPADCWGRITADLRTVNKLAVPFLDDDGGGGEDYVLQPPPKKLGTLQLTGLAFFAVSGSAYGIEEAVSSAGPFLAPLAFVLAPLVWSAPLVLVASELSVALPHSGGYIVWVNTAFGPLLSLLNGMANLLCNVLDCALYPVLLTDYLQRAVLPMLHPSMHEWWREQCAARAIRRAIPRAILPRSPLLNSFARRPTFVGTVLRLALVGIAALVNVLNVNLVGVGAGALMAVVSLPFVALALAAAAAPTFDASALFDTDTSLWPEGRSGWLFFATLVLWNNCGYDSAGMVAGEVAAPRSSYPRALWGALAATVPLYVLPLAACAAADHDWRKWREGQFLALAQEFGGSWLLSAMTVAFGAIRRNSAQFSHARSIASTGGVDRLDGRRAVHAHVHHLTRDLRDVPAADAAGAARTPPPGVGHAARRRRDERRAHLRRRRLPELRSLT